MNDINRRRAILFALSAPFSHYAADAATEQPQESQHKMPAGVNVHWTGDEQIAMLMYPGMTVLDLIGPQAMFGALMGAKVHLVAKTTDPVTSDGGVTIMPTATFRTCPSDLTVLFTPGGTDGTLAAAKDPETLAFMTERGARAKYITSVCSGSLILGAAGLLKGYKATSHWSVRHVLSGFGAIPTDARVVRDRNRSRNCAIELIAFPAEIRKSTTDPFELRDEGQPRRVAGVCHDPRAGTIESIRFRRQRTHHRQRAAATVLEGHAAAG